jgi:hypothetical protein
MADLQAVNSAEKSAVHAVAELAASTVGKKVATKAVYWATAPVFARYTALTSRNRRRFSSNLNT